MGVLLTGNSYSTNDQVTATNLNASINSATFTSSAVDGVTTDLSGGAITVRDSGVTTAKVADSAITTAKVASATSTATGITFPKMRYINNLKVIGNVSGGATNPAEVTVLDDDTMATASATTLATSESIKAYSDSLISGFWTFSNGSSGNADGDLTNGGANDLSNYEFNGLPSGISEITVFVRGASGTTAANLELQLSNSSSYVVSGYQESYGSRIGSTTVASGSSGTGIPLPVAAGSNSFSPVYKLYKVVANEWVCEYSGGGNGVSVNGGGYIVLAGEMDGVRLSLSSGFFDSGSVRLRYR